MGMTINWTIVGGAILLLSVAGCGGESEGMNASPTVTENTNALALPSTKLFSVQTVVAGNGTVQKESQLSASAVRATFTHPGIMLNLQQLDFLKEKIKASEQPWKNAYDEAAASKLGSLSYHANPFKKVECGSKSQNPSKGCKEEREDAAAAYTHALMWYLSGKEEHAKKSIEIMNAWSKTLTGGTNSHTAANEVLQASWSGEIWPRAAEIIRYTYTGWAQTDIDKFKGMLTGQYLKEIQTIEPCRNGNWLASAIAASMNIAVFTDDRKLFDSTVAKWRKQLPATFYLISDGAIPSDPPNCKMTDVEAVKYWLDHENDMSDKQAKSLLKSKPFLDGQAQETCRDFKHAGYAFAALMHSAETARIQGVDLYGEQASRVTKTMEFHAQYENSIAPPRTLCQGTRLKLGMKENFEIAYNHYHNRLGYVLPQTLQTVLNARSTGSFLHMNWETLTHAEVGPKLALSVGN